MRNDDLKPVREVAVIGSRHQDGYLDRIACLFKLLEAEGIAVTVEERFASYLEDCGLESVGTVVGEPGVGCGAVISIGGDGTFLRSARWAGRRGVPVMGINTGHLGFLSSYSIDDIESIPGELRRGEAVVERRSMLRVECDSLPADVWPYALNEVTMIKEDTSSMISVEAEINGFFLADYLADGLIVATPTGSTAYNLSVGGPLLEPTLDCMVLSPIAPHSLTMRPLVVDGCSRLRLKGNSRAGRFRVSLDNRSFIVGQDTVIEVRRGEFYANVIRKAGSDFAVILRNKLYWGL